MTIEEATAKVKSLSESHGGKIKATVNFEFDEGRIHLDDTVSPTIVNNEAKTAACTFKMSLANFDKLMQGDLNPMMAFMSGKIKIDGDKGVAMKLSSIF
jgi:putative sterol carrier protein